MPLDDRDPPVEKLAARTRGRKGAGNQERPPGSLGSGAYGNTTVEELLAIANRAAAHVKRPYVDHAELLYDDNGLPK
ncbi:MAG: hypothetical protein ACLPWF_09250 [Bryobacteraceae bacterium]